MGYRSIERTNEDVMILEKKMQDILQENANLRKEKEAILNAKTYKVGHFVTTPYRIGHRLLKRSSKNE